MNINYQELNKKVRAKIVFPLHKNYFYTKWYDRKTDVDDIINFHFTDSFKKDMLNDLTKIDESNLVELYKKHRYSKSIIQHIYLISNRLLYKADEVLTNISLSKAVVPEFPNDILTNKYLRKL